MAPEVRVHNPTTSNPKGSKPWTEKQAAARKDQAEKFTRDVVEDDERADEIADMSPAEYAAQRGKQVVSTPRRRNNQMKRKSSSSGSGSNGDNDMIRINAHQAVQNTKLMDQNQGLQAQVTKLQAKNKSLQRKINEIQDLTEADDDPDDLLQDIQDVIGANGGGNGNGGGSGNGGSDDDDDDDQ